MTRPIEWFGLRWHCPHSLAGPLGWPSITWLPSELSPLGNSTGQAGKGFGSKDPLVWMALSSEDTGGGAVEEAAADLAHQSLSPTQGA